MSIQADIIVIGAGIAGTSAAAQLAKNCSVILLEMEKQPGYHATGRSAAVYAPAYGNKVVRDITVAGAAFFRSPPDNFSEVALLRPRDSIFIAQQHQISSLERTLIDSKHLSEMTAGQLKSRIPILDNQVVAGALDSTGGDLDVDAIMQGFLRQFQHARGKLVTQAPVVAMTHQSGSWRLKTPSDEFEAPIVVNAAGAWADSVAVLAGLRPLKIQPNRRTAILVDAPDNMDISGWPVVIDIDEKFYFKPEAGQLMLSPADETATEPCDAVPEEIDIAIAIDRIQQVTSLKVRKVNHSRAGLRSFAPDRTFVVGFDPRIDGFFWLAGQGGYGVQSAPGLADITSYLITNSHCLITREAVKSHLEDIKPDRLL